MLSGDTKFASPGNKTGIDYIADFDHYVARIDELVRKGTRSITDTFQFYNDHVFAPSRTLQSVVPTKVPVSASEEEEAIWKSLEEIDNEPDSDSEISGIAGAAIISSDEATMSPPNELPVADHHPVMNDVSPCPAGVDIDTSSIPLDLGKTSCSKKKVKKVVTMAPMAPSRVTCSCVSQTRGIAEGGNTVTTVNQAPKRKGRAKEASIAAQPSRINNAIPRINVPADVATSTLVQATTPGVRFADSVKDYDGENEDEEDEEEEEEEEEEESE